MRLPLAVAATLAGLLATGLPAAPAGAATGTATPTAAPTSATRGGVVVRRDSRGRAHYLAPRSGKAIGRTSSVPSTFSPSTAARQQLRRYGSVFGVTDHTLRAAGVRPLLHGRSSVRFQQTAHGLPVLGAQLATVVDRAGGLLAVTGETSGRVLSTTYGVTARAAQAAALRATARDQHLAKSTLRASSAQRWLYDPSIFDDAAAAGSRASWLVTVTAGIRLDVRELVVVDGATGAVRLHVNQVERLDRVVCDNRNVRRDDYVCRNGRYARGETTAASAVPDVNQAFDNAGATANFYAALGVDLTALIGSDLGDGKKIRSTVRVCPTSSSCPFQNAFWDGRQMVYGSGFASADDVIAHELTHGVTQHTSGLVYWYESGAINESMSDVFGELVDQTDGLGNDDPTKRWLLGEDIPAPLGVDPVARNMANPPAKGQPDQVGGPGWLTDAEDNGEVHTNDGVGNKAAYLITDGTVAEPGGAFGGFAFPGLGVDVAARLYWTAQTLLTPGADYADLGNALYAACLTIGVPQASCDLTVRGAINATLMQRPDFAAPTEPQGLIVTGADGGVRVRWSPPASPGTSPITSYVLVVTPAVRGVNFLTLDLAPRDQVINGLPASRTFTIGLMAVNAQGNSPVVAQTLQGTHLTLRGKKVRRAGQRLRLHGRLSIVANNAGLGHRRVLLRERLAGQKRFHVLARTRTRVQGGYRFRVRVRARAAYVTTFAAGTNVLLGTHSTVHGVRVRRR